MIQKNCLNLQSKSSLIMIRTLTISLVTLCLFPIKGRSQVFELRKENDSLYWLGVKGGSKSDEWRLAHPVYQFQTGDVDGDGSEDAMVGVIKKTRYYPMGRRLEDFRFVAPAEGDSVGRIRALESTTDSLYVVSDYKWSGFGMKFERFVIKGVDKETALRKLKIEN